MAATSAVTTVGTTAVSIASVPADPNADASQAEHNARRVVVRSTVASGTIFLGGPGVTTANGFSLTTASGQTVDVVLEPGESLFAVAAAAGQGAAVLITGR